MDSQVKNLLKKLFTKGLTIKELEKLEKALNKN